jgi:oxidase EvaA
VKPEYIRYSTLQSEEGGRFYREQNKNLIIEVDSAMPRELPDNYIWMTLKQLKEFIRFNNYLNIQARSLLASIELK